MEIENVQGQAEEEMKEEEKSQGNMDFKLNEQGLRNKLQI